MLSYMDHMNKSTLSTCSTTTSLVRALHLTPKCILKQCASIHRVNNFFKENYSRVDAATKLTDLSSLAHVSCRASLLRYLEPLCQQCSFYKPLEEHCSKDQFQGSHDCQPHFPQWNNDFTFKVW